MNYENLPKTLLGQVKAADLAAYADFSGWTLFPSKRPSMAIFRRPESKNLEMAFPLSDEYADYQDRILDALNVLSKFEKRTYGEILTDVLFHSSDQEDFRYEAPETSKGTIPLDAGVSLLTGARKALLAAACDVIKPQKFHPRMSRAKAEEFLKGCQMGQTKFGSYVISVVCPLNIEISESPQIPLFEQIPNETFTRQVTKHLMRSIAYVVSSLEMNQGEKLVNTHQEGICISANLCEALLEILNPMPEQALLQVSSTWAKSLPISADIPSSVKVGKSLSRKIEEVSKALRPRAEAQPRRLIGRIDDLTGEVGPDGKRFGDVKFTFIDDEGEPVTAKITLDSAEYDQAWQAHNQPGFYASVEGVLHRAGRTNYIRDHKDFKILKG